MPIAPCAWKVNQYLEEDRVNTRPQGFKNATFHRYIQTSCYKSVIYILTLTFFQFSECKPPYNRSVETYR